MFQGHDLLRFQTKIGEKIVAVYGPCFWVSASEYAWGRSYEAYRPPFLQQSVLAKERPEVYFRDKMSDGYRATRALEKSDSPPNQKIRCQSLFRSQRSGCVACPFAEFLSVEELHQEGTGESKHDCRLKHWPLRDDHGQHAMVCVRFLRVTHSRSTEDHANCFACLECPAARMLHVADCDCQGHDHVLQTCRQGSQKHHGHANHPDRVQIAANEMLLSLPASVYYCLRSRDCPGVGVEEVCHSHQFARGWSKFEGIWYCQERSEGREDQKRLNRCHLRPREEGVSQRLLCWNGSRDSLFVNAGQQWKRRTSDGG